MQVAQETITIAPAVKARIDELNKSSFEMRNRDPKLALTQAEEALQLSETNSYTKGRADAICNIAFQKLQDSELEKALELLFTALSIFEEIGDEAGISNAQYNLAVLHLRFANFNVALEALHKSIEIREKLNDKAGLASCYFQLGYIHEMFKNLTEALEIATKGLIIRKELNDNIGEAAFMFMLGGIHIKMKKYDLARTELYGALRMRNENEDFRGYFANLFRLVELNVECGELDEALKNFDVGYRMVEIAQDSFGMMRFCQVRGKIAVRKNDVDEAIHYYSESLRLAEGRNFKSVIYENCEQLSDLYLKKGDHKAALEYYKRFHQLKEDVLSSQSSSQLKSIQLMNQITSSKREAELERVKNTELKNAFDIIEEKNKDITDSIHSALRIQRAILPTNEEVKRLFPESFVLFKPRDIVSGDFYWISEIGDKTLIAAVDCTGHGVPGAFMSMIGNALLNQIVNEKHITAPCEVLFHLRESIIRSLKQTGAIGEGKEGMDIALCAIDKKSNTLEFAGAHNPLWIFRKNGEFEEILADKQPIGLQYEELRPFTNHTITLEKGDRLYIFTDGYADQFGGPNGKKFKYKQLQERLVAIGMRPMETQKEILDSAFVEWRGGLEQIDDVLVIGIGK